MKWSILLPTGEYLDTPPDFEIQFELSNQVFVSGNTSALPGSFSFPVDVPLTPLIRRQLNFPDRIDNASSLTSIEGACAYAEGIRMFPGTIKILDVTRNSVKISLVSSHLSTLKDTTLPELDLGGERTFAPSSLANFMLDTAENPEDYDFAFFNVYNDGAPAGFNVWDTIAEEFLPDDSIITPFVRLDYLLQQMFLITEYQFSNEFQVNLELGRLYVFNNADARQLSDTPPITVVSPSVFDLKKHLPDISCADFLKKVMAQWCLGLFTNIFDKTSSLIPLNNILARAPKHNWTDYADYDYTLNFSDAQKAPGYFNYTQPNALPSHYPPIEDITLVYTAEEYEALPPVPDDYYYIENLSAYIQATSGANGRIGLFHRGVMLGEGEDYDAGMECFFDFYDGLLCNVPYSGWIDDGGLRWEKQDCPVVLMFYRGLQDVIGGANNSTVNSNTIWRENSGVPPEKFKLVTAGVDVADCDQSMNWFGEYGLYEKYHKIWAQMLMNNKHVTQSFILPITTLTAFSFEDKIRVGNMDFFAKRLRIQKLLDRGRVLVEASMVSVI
jgi:hypothetical protein